MHKAVQSVKDRRSGHATEDLTTLCEAVSLAVEEEQRSRPSKIVGNKVGTHETW